MSIWCSVGDDAITTKGYVHSGHRPSQHDDAGPTIDLAYVPRHISKGVWVRLVVDDDGDRVRMVLGRRAVTELRDTLTAILQGDR